MFSQRQLAVELSRFAASCGRGVAVLAIVAVSRRRVASSEKFKGRPEESG
jgi:hypothetical protein